MEPPNDRKPLVLVLAPKGRDASVIAQVLAPLEFEIQVCANLVELSGALRDDATVALLTEEALNHEEAKALHAWIESQPSWSDFPFVVLATKQLGSRSSQAAAALESLGNAVLLERPLNADTLVSAVKSAWRSRRRQYEARTQLQRHEAIGLENHRLYEAERHARADAEAANRAKDEFLATLSHELRTPLSAILGWTYVLQQRRAELGNMARGIDTIQRNANSQARLIEDLLDMSRIVAGKVTLELQTVVPAQLLEQVAASLLPTAEAKRIQLTCSLASGMTPIVGDSQRLLQVFRNLLGNAVKFTPEGGTVRVEVSHDHQDMVVSVTDSGVGIAPDFLPHVFERFRQADGSTTRSQGGLGLGLAIVRRLVELHDGTVSAFSDGLGRGATFELRLPMGKHVPSGDVRQTVGGCAVPFCSPPDQRIQDIKILLVEDDDDGREMIDQLLSDQGGKVVAVDSAAHALAALRAGLFDVVVSDIGMPEIDGYELLRRIRAEGNPIPAIALTAFARAEDRAKASEAGYATHISKPVEPPVLIAAVASVVRQER